MGCFYSKEGHERCAHCNRRAVNNLVIIDHVCEICVSAITSTRYSPREPKFGEFRCCTCNRYWSSRYCWPDKYQICKQCKKPSLAFNHRDLKPTDITKSVENGQEHLRDLCQMCQQLGYSCKNFGKPPKAPASTKPTTKKCYQTHHKTY